MQGVMLHRCLALAALLAAIALGSLQPAGGQRASGQPVQRPSASGAAGIAGITVQGMLEEGGQVRRHYSCPARFVRMGNSCYFLSRTMASWHDAHFRCQAMRADLAAFEKRSENAHMRKFLQREEMALLSRWIGGIYQWEKRLWMWGSSGLQVTYKAFPRRMVSREWAWHCISMDPTSGYRWRPESCFDVKHYICETPLRLTRLRTQAGSKQHKGPRRKGDGVFVDKEGRGGDQPLTAANGTTIAAAPGSRRTDGRRPNRVGGGTVFRHNQASRSRAPPPPPGAGPGPRRWGPVRRRPQGPGDVDHAYVYPSVRKAAAASAARGGPRRPQQSHGLGDGDKVLAAPRRRPPVMPDATVQTLYQPPIAKDDNDFSNDV